MDNRTRSASACERPNRTLRPAACHTDSGSHLPAPRCESGFHIELQRDDNLYLRPEQAIRELLPPEAAAAYLRVLLRTGASLLAAGDRGLFADTLLSQLIDITGSDRAVLVRRDAEDGSDTVISSAVRSGIEAEPALANRAIVERVLDTGISVAANAAPALGEGLSTLAVPLAAFQRVIGAIYLEGATPLRYGEDTVRLVTAIGAMAATVLERTIGLEVPPAAQAPLRTGFAGDHGIIGRSPQIEEVCRFIARVAPVETTVLIHGESGTGKELVVRALHENSSRARGPFVALNCAALTETLLESELFGHEKGSFTGAAGQKKGLIEAANGGTFFLDELGELAPPLQAKLLRALQERTVVRVGGVHPIPVNVRLVAATNKDLAAEVRKGTFRQDLFYRLNVVSVTLPPLRERGADVLLLANHFLGKYARDCGRSIRGLSPETRTLLRQYEWPGNVRELQNAIERAVLLTDSDTIGPADLPEAIHARSAAIAKCSKPAFRRGVTELKKQMLREAIEQSGGNVTEAARQLGLHRNYVYRLVRSMELRENQSAAG